MKRWTHIETPIVVSLAVLVCVKTVYGVGLRYSLISLLRGVVDISEVIIPPVRFYILYGVKECGVMVVQQ
jgi:hypothetical protein